VELVLRLLVLGEIDDRVFEGEQDARVDVERQVQIKWSAAALLGMKIDFPGLSQRIRLDEVALVVHVEAVIDGVVLDLRDVPGHVDDCHPASVCRTLR
jgi:hypothetical protein